MTEIEAETLRKFCMYKSLHLLVAFVMAGFFATAALGATWDYYHADHLRPHIENVDIPLVLEDSKKKLGSFDLALTETYILVPMISAGILNADYLTADYSTPCSSPKLGRSPPLSEPLI